MTTVLNRDQPKHSQDVIRRLAIALITPAMFLAAIMPSAPGVDTVMAEECEVPAESEEETQEAREECVVSSERRVHTLPNYGHWIGCSSFGYPATTHRRSAAISLGNGHRLAHDLLAPMTC